MNENKLQTAIDNSKVNRNGGHYTPGHSYSTCRIAECIDTHHCMHERDGKAPSIRACTVVAKIGSKDLASRIVLSIKHEREFKEIKHGHQRQGALSLTMGTDLLNIELHMLCLQ